MRCIKPPRSGFAWLDACNRKPKAERLQEYRYNSRNQLTELTGAGKQTSYKYDPAGNLTQEQRFIQERSETRNYTYDAYNRNTEVKGEGFIHRNFYDAEGLRNRIEENGKVTDFVYSGDMLYSEKEESGTTERRYILGNEYLGHEDIKGTEPDSNASQKQAYSYITDEQGSLRYILNADRQIEAYQEYSAFGERIVSEGGVSRLGYNSQTEDELTGLTYLRARYYNPAIGRFTQEDVIYDDGFNLYAYCDSNPVIYCDPSGFEGKPLHNCKKIGVEGDSDPVYKPSPKHDPASGWGSPNPIPDVKTGQELLDSAYTSSKNKQLYNIYDGQLVKFQPDTVEGWHSYLVSNPAKEVPTDVLRKMLNDGKITKAQYKNFIKNK